MKSGRGVSGCFVVLIVAGIPSFVQATPPASPESRAIALVGQMSLAEKVSQLQSDAPAIPRLGVRAYHWWNEGLHGAARSGYATVFPQAIGLAASWDSGLLRSVGNVVSQEQRARFDSTGTGRDHGIYEGLTLWSPNVNIFRDPRWGRGQETYGEDPYLTGRLAVAYVRGIQGDDPDHPRAIATPKHFAVHSGPEAGRHGFDVDVSAHDLEATFLPAFRAAITEGGAGSIMCGYNALHGVPVCASQGLLGETLRKAWGFRGFVVSDCDAIDDMTRYHDYRSDNAGSSADAIRAGTDLDCGNAYAQLTKAVVRGDVAESVLDTSLVRLFAARYRLGEMGSPESGSMVMDTRANAALALQAALESMVLLRNDNDVLPLRGKPRIAVIGPNADTTETLEANYHGTSRNPITPLQGLRNRFGAEHIVYAQGSTIADGVPVPVPETALRTDVTAGAAGGLVGTYFDHATFTGTPRLTRTDRIIDFDWDHVSPASPAGGAYAVRWTGALVPPAPGEYRLAVHVDRCFDCVGHDPVRLFVDGHPLIEDSGDDTHTQGTVHFNDTRPHDIRLEYEHRGNDQGIRLQWLPPAQGQLAEAGQMISSADVVVAFVGLSPDVEGEELRVDVPGFSGGDRTDIALPAAQRDLLEQARASGKPVVIVLMSGGAVALDWAKEHASAMIVAWYPGESGGAAIAQVLAGDYNPAGRLPVTFYRSLHDLPPFISYRMEGRTYRYFRGDPLYAFGHGLSYTRFGYSDAKISREVIDAGQPVTASVTVSNEGERPGDEVVQAYLTCDSTDPLAPLRTLVGFSRRHLKPGEKQRVAFPVDARALSSVDAAGVRAVEAGPCHLFVGGGQPDDAVGQKIDFSIRGHQVLPR